MHENSRESMAGVLGAAGVVSGAAAAALRGEYSEVTVVPVATAGACNPPCTTIFPFLVLLFFMTFVVAVTQMPLLMIVLRFVLFLFLCWHLRLYHKYCYKDLCGQQWR